MATGTKAVIVDEEREDRFKRHFGGRIVKSW